MIFRRFSTRRFLNSMACAAFLGCQAPFSVAAAPFFNEAAGKPAAGPLPEYCQMGECELTTVEGIDPTLFAESGVLFRVMSQNWDSKMDDRRRRRGADTISYVFCSKRMPAVIDPAGEGGHFLVTFLAPDKGDAYGHANETVMALYFVVCHSRAFKGDLMDAGPAFARSLGYDVSDRGDQPTIVDPREILKFLK